MIEYKSPEQIRKMRRAALVVVDIHDALREQIEPGMTTADLDAIALEVLQAAGAASNFYGYYGFSWQICTSVNDVIVHGIPGERVLEPGDIVSLDCGSVVDGWHGDAAFTVVLPGGDPQVRAARERLSQITHDAMWAGVAAMARGKRVRDIGAAVEDLVNSVPVRPAELLRSAEQTGSPGLPGSAGALTKRPDIVRDYVGHGIGSTMHQEPDVHHYRTRGRSPRLKNGMVLCIEPMLAAGDQANKVLDDEWTVVTIDGSDAAHWEHMVAKHSGGIWVLTARDGGAEGLAPYGIEPAPLD